MTTSLKCFIAYYRVSTQKQGKSGLGLDAQRKSVRTHVAGSGTIRKEYTEVESGRKAKRPQLEKALRYAQRKGCTLIIAKLDRLSRNAAFLNQVMDSGVEIVAVDMPTANRMVLGIMAQVAQHEAEMISQRTKAALQAAKDRGQKLGSLNRKWRKAMKGRIGNFLPEARTASIHSRQDAAQEHAECMKEELTLLRVTKSMSLRDIAKQLNEQDEFHPRRGDTWKPGQVQRVLHRLNIV